MIIFDDDLDPIEIPEDVSDLEVFRQWAASPGFPQRGRIDYLQGLIEVDMSPEDLQNHGTLKTELLAYVQTVVRGKGQLFSDRSRVTHPAVGLSCEPDVVYVSYDTLRSGRARYSNPSKTSEKLIEIVGSPDLVVEIVSDSSVSKDLKRLPRLYAEAGIPELWLLDARAETLSLEIRYNEQREWQNAAADADGYLMSRVLGKQVLVRREPWEMPGIWQYFIDERAPQPGLR
ncbi:MAG: Uma2 family endonuclease [Candidatus Xenobia bacterium]